MKALRKLATVSLLGTGLVLGFFSSLPSGHCNSRSSRCSCPDTCDRDIDTGRLFLNTQNRFCARGNPCDSSAFNDSAVREGAPQSIDLEDDGVSAPHKNIIRTISSPPCIKIHDHCINKTSALCIPLYLLKSSFLL